MNLFNFFLIFNFNLYVFVNVLQRQVLSSEETGDVVRDTEMPHAEPKVKLSRGQQVGGEQPMGEPEVGGEQTTGDSDTSREGETQTALVPSEVVTVTLLQAVDGPILERLRLGYLPLRTNDKVQYGAGQSYTRRRVKHMARKGIVDYVGSRFDE